MNEIKLVPFSDKNADQVLMWRNSSRIQSNMLDDSHISFKSHKEFLNRLHLDLMQAYYVIELNCLPVASIYFSGLGTERVTWGCYIGVEKILPGFFVALVIISGQFAFARPQTKLIRSEVASHNSNPIKLNKFLGIAEVQRITRNTSQKKKIEFIEFHLDRSNFDLVCKKGLKIIPSSIKMALDNLIMEK